MKQIRMADGTRISRFIWPDGSVRNLSGNDIAYIMNHYHGDHDDDWIIIERNGKEVQRTNARYVDTIVWLDEADRPERR